MTAGTMIRTSFFFAATLFLGACQTDGVYTTRAQPPAKPTAPARNGWQPNEQFETTPYNKILDRPAYTARIGTTPGGFPYRYFKDGSGSVNPGQEAFSGWGIDCTRDKMTDKRGCTLKGYDLHLFVSFSSAMMPQWICLTEHDFPGRTGAIRIDQDAAITTDKDGCIPGRHLSRLSAGKKITTRAVKWPYDYYRDKEGPLDGLADAISLASFINMHVDELDFPVLISAGVR